MCSKTLQVEAKAKVLNKIKKIYTVNSQLRISFKIKKSNTEEGLKT